MACHLTYIRLTAQATIFDLTAYMDNMGVKPDNFDLTTRGRIGELEKMFSKSVTDENNAEYIAGIAEVVQYVEAAQQAMGKHLSHTHSLEGIVDDIASSSHAGVFGLASTYQHTESAGHYHDGTYHHHEHPKLEL
jgi:hypothetical protein